jgi:hypothetical protein
MYKTKGGASQIYENLPRSQRFLEKESLKHDIESRPIYKEIIYMHMGPIVKEKCMHMG